MRLVSSQEFKILWWSFLKFVSAMTIFWFLYLWHLILQVIVYVCQDFLVARFDYLHTQDIPLVLLWRCFAFNAERPDFLIRSRSHKNAKHLYGNEKTWAKHISYSYQQKRIFGQVWRWNQNKLVRNVSTFVQYLEDVLSFAEIILLRRKKPRRNSTSISPMRVLHGGRGRLSRKCRSAF